MREHLKIYFKIF